MVPPNCSKSKEGAADQKLLRTTAPVSTLSHVRFDREGKVLSEFIEAKLYFDNKCLGHSMNIHRRPGVNFINMHTCSFYKRRSKKHKKTFKSSVEKKVDQLVVLLYFSGFELYAMLSSLIKLTQGYLRKKMTLVC